MSLIVGQMTLDATDAQNAAMRCSVAGCERKHNARGYCHTHYWRLRNIGDAQPDRPVRAPSIVGPCQAEGCARESEHVGLCHRHYERRRRTGSPLGTTRPTPLARLFSRTRVTDGCWVFVGSRNGDGYGTIGFRGRVVGAHRLAYELLVGPVPTGLELDHLCRNRACVNPDHLEPVPHAENVRRGVRAA